MQPAPFRFLPFRTELPNGRLDSHRAQQIIPKGLLPFDENDAGFFLDLLPGPKDPFGNSECIRFWISRLAGRMGNCSHGLMYGPPGCGKTSLIRAGLLPQLPEGIETVYVDCSTESENSILELVANQAGLRPGEKTDLTEALRRTREGKVAKPSSQLLIVLDQFEHFLSKTDDLNSSDLVRALRHCDGERIRCLISVRDDFWTRTQEFLRLQEIRIQDGRNSLAVQLFDGSHARKVLLEFGKAYGKVESDGASRANLDFVEKAIAAISEQGKVNCGHLAILASVTRDKEWTSASLDQLGDWQGIVIRFMEESFCHQTAPISQRRLRPTLTAIIECLLPTNGRSATSCTATLQELIAACPPGTKAEDFQDAMTLLERRCRLVKPVHRTFVDANCVGYQLANELLVDPLRRWIRLEKRLTWRGRALADLGDYAEIGMRQIGDRYYPSLINSMRIKIATWNQNIDARYATYLSRAIRFRTWRFLSLAAVILTLTSVFWFSLKQLDKNRQIQLQYANYLIGPANQIGRYLDLFSANNLDIDSVSKRLDLATDREKFRHSLAEFVLDGETQSRQKELIQLAVRVDPQERSVMLESMDRVPEGAFVSLGMMARSGQSPLERTRMAVLAYELGDSEPIQDIIAESQTEPTGMLFLKHQFAAVTSLSMDQIAEQVLDGDESLPIKLLLLSVLFENDNADRISPELHQELIDFAQFLYKESTDAYAHSLAKWLLRSRGETIPDLEPGSRGDWELLENGITMLEIAGEPYSMVDHNDLVRSFTIDNFWVSDLEITTEQFLDFVKDDNYDGQRPNRIQRELLFSNRQTPQVWEFDGRATPAIELPVVRVSPRHAAMFCNWLSKKNGLQPAYSFPDRVMFVANDSANGYRLPNSNEMQYLMRAGYSGKTFMGDVVPRKWLRHYASFLEFIDDEARERLVYANFIGGIRMPNRLGLFDVIGSVDEHCLDIEDGKLKFQLFGLSSHDFAAEVFTGRVDPNRASPNTLHSKCGFRVARNR
jgi:formylglycine-generating enzyme required for sulfatase activity